MKMNERKKSHWFTETKLRTNQVKWVPLEGKQKKRKEPPTNITTTTSSAQNQNGNVKSEKVLSRHDTEDRQDKAAGHLPRHSIKKHTKDLKELI